jgi:hypothetical protein
MSQKHFSQVCVKNNCWFGFDHLLSFIHSFIPLFTCV